MKKFIFVFALAALVSCVNEPHGNFDYAVFNRERQFWLEEGIQDYFFHKIEGDTTGPWGVFMYIQDGVLAYIQLPEDDVPVPVSVIDKEKRYFKPKFFGYTISDVYAKIETVARSAGRCDTLEIQYDSEWHYPAYFCYDRADGNFILIQIDTFSVGKKCAPDISNHAAEGMRGY
jgi:hypothetical protein